MPQLAAFEEVSEITIPQNRIYERHSAGRIGTNEEGSPMVAEYPGSNGESLVIAVVHPGNLG
jgi:hypothetical protein